MEIDELLDEAEQALQEQFKQIDKLTYKNSQLVLDAFHKNRISENHFTSTTGYGYGDLGREAIENVFSTILGAEASLVRNQFISGSHALNVCLFACTRPNDTILTLTGEPYDTLKEVIGITENPSSLNSYGVKYEQINLKNDDFNYEEIETHLKNKFYKLIHIQRSRGYATRASLTIDKLKKVISLIKKLSPETIIMVDNCYCEFVESTSPLQVGADLIVGSLIKNLGGGVAPNGAYIAGKKGLIKLCAERLTLPGEGSEVGPTLGINSLFLKGIYMAPSAVGASLKSAVLASYILEKLGFNVSPKYNGPRADIVEMISFNDPEKLIKFTQGIQKGSAIDAHAIPEPTDMPGYEDKIIMASGSFTQGSSIEISADGPIRPPYACYLQGGLTYEYARLALKEALKNLEEQNDSKW